MDKRSWIGFALAVAASTAMAQATPQGLWRTIDDDSGKEKSLVRIVDNGGVFGGRIEKLLDATKQDVKCDKCSDARKGQPVLGMTILENVRKNADEPYWDGGTILDPNNGKSYRVRLTPKDGGKTLEVRGFIGPFYRNQTWQRVE
ncbi:hypothetical protein CKO44_19545 [Rubrivivax gelatinosus]|uniref:DUF2147 domain-containing protein n=1 Tax=Rubrivivax gelatinosus TaxID=28068 RepID=A0ABS1DYB4_RUBGE|nr:DUF2147 domain-containing protein [Rubrivivax gelatinosus]MBK1615658.1 hypothetical protein [Rubrivivax gelatinosus]MBK1714533.1 hypothetical protein [Rubrivivax gelatinosus]